MSECANTSISLRQEVIPRLRSIHHSPEPQHILNFLGMYVDQLTRKESTNDVNASSFQRKTRKAGTRPSFKEQSNALVL